MFTSFSLFQNASKASRIHWPVLALCLGMAAGVLAGCRTPVLEQQDGLVKVYSRKALLPSTGAPDDEILEFQGKRYPHLFSSSYVVVPELNAILFATRDEGENVKLHYVPKQGPGELTVEEGEVYAFGRYLGEPKDALDTEYVESVADGRITFFSSPDPADSYRGRTQGHRYVLDLRAHSFAPVRDADSAK